MKRIIDILFDLCGLAIIIVASMTLTLQETETVQFRSQSDYVVEYLRILSLDAEKPLKFPHIVYTQALLETARFTSKVYWENNNAVGMKPNRRGYSIDNVNCGDRVHACYESLWDNLLDYRDWQYERLQLYENHFSKTVNDDEEYLLFLDNLVLRGRNGLFVTSYAEDPQYTRKLRKLLSSAEVTDSGVFEIGSQSW